MNPFMSEKDRQDLRDAGRGHLLGEYRSPLDVADEARKRQREEPQMNTDKAEILGQAVPAATNPGVTSGVRDGDSQGPDAQLADPTMSEAMTGVSEPVQNDGDDDIETDETKNDDSANDDELGPDPFE